MRLAVLIHRKNYYRLLGPVVDEALRRGHVVECWHDWSRARGSVKEFPDVAPPFRAGRPEVVTFSGAADLVERWRVDPPDAVVSIDPPDPEVRGAAKTRWVWLQYGADMVMLETAGRGITARGIADADSVAVYSDYWAREMEGWGPEAGVVEGVAGKAEVGGEPGLDALAAIDGGEVRRRHGLPSDRPIVLYLPFPLRSNIRAPWLANVHRPSSRLVQALRTAVGGPRAYWPDVTRGRNDRRIVEAMRAFCDAGGALLVMKSRVKDRVPRYAERLADRVFYALPPSPPTILGLLSVASLGVHFYSTAVLEAACAAVPSLCLAPRAAELGPASYGFDRVHHGELGGMYNAPGVAYWRPLAEAFDGLAGWELGDFPLDSAARPAYVGRLLGLGDGGSSGRLLRVAGPGRGAPAARLTAPTWTGW